MPVVYTVSEVAAGGCVWAVWGGGGGPNHGTRVRTTEHVTIYSLASPKRSEKHVLFMFFQSLALTLVRKKTKTSSINKRLFSGSCPVPPSVRNYVWEVRHRGSILGTIGLRNLDLGSHCWGKLDHHLGKQNKPTRWKKKTKTKRRGASQKNVFPGHGVSILDHFGFCRCSNFSGSRLPDPTTSALATRRPTSAGQVKTRMSKCPKVSGNILGVLKIYSH